MTTPPSSAPGPLAPPDLVALLVHDLRNPLAGVTAALQLLGMGLSETEQEEVLAEATWAAGRLQRMVTDLLLAHGAAADADAPVAPVALRPVVEAATRVAALLGRLEGIQVALADGPEAAIPGDPQAVRHLLETLLVTVVRHGSSGGRVQVGLDTTPAGAQVAVTVSPGGLPAAVRAAMAESGAASWSGRAWRGDPSGAMAVTRLLVKRLGAHLHSPTDPNDGDGLLLTFPYAPDDPAGRTLGDDAGGATPDPRR